MRPREMAKRGMQMPEGMRVARSIQPQEHSLGGDAMLPAVAFSAERLLLAPDWAEAIDEVLMHLGIAADVSRAVPHPCRPGKPGRVHRHPARGMVRARRDVAVRQSDAAGGVRSRRPASPGGSS